MAAVGALQDEAAKRKERLLALKQKRSRTNDPDEPQNKIHLSDDGEKLPKPKFRSYNPQDELLKENKVEKIKPSDFSEKIQTQLEAAKPQQLVEEVDLINLAPRKPDWDLKRDAAKKLAKLEKRTQRAIAELIRDRLQTGKEDLAAAVDAGTRTEENEEEDD